MTTVADPALFEPAVLEGVAGPIVAVHHPPRGGAGRARAVIYLPPFAEELNRARRMASLQAQSLSAAGIGVLTLDPYGCGDSGGDFRDARWDIWRDDAARAVAWMRQQGYESITALGLRLGALLALDLAGDRHTRIARVVLWQPVLRGEQLMTQFLRLRLAAELSTGAGAREGTAELRRLLSQRESVEVAGYELNPDLVAAIDRLKLVELGLACSAPIDWIELVAREGQAPSPAHEPVAARWRDAGVALNQHRVVGEPFWSLQETAIAPALIALTTDLLRRS